jgi:hypothetical protein
LGRWAHITPGTAAVVAAIFFSCGFLSEKFVDFVKESSVFWSSVRVRHSLDAVAMVGEVHDGHAGDFPVQKQDN